MKHQAHLITSEFPIKDLYPQTSECGEELSKARIEFVWDALEVGSEVPASTIGLCNACVVKAFLSERRRYIYGITDSAKADG